MRQGETLYLVLVIASFAAFAVVLAYQSVLQSRSNDKHSASGREQP